jgi:hypothetical protein
MSSQVRIEHNLPLPMILLGESHANYVCRCDFASEVKRGRKLEMNYYHKLTISIKDLKLNIEIQQLED